MGAQALILRDNGYRCDEAVLYYDATRQRVRIAIDDALVSETAAVLGAPRGRWPKAALFRRRWSIAPSARAARWSASACPTRPRCGASRSRARPSQLSLFDRAMTVGQRVRRRRRRRVRRLVPARDDLRPLYVTGHGLLIGKSGEVLADQRAGQSGPGGAHRRDLAGQHIRQRASSPPPRFKPLPERKADRSFLLWRLVLRPHAGAGSQECFPAAQAIRAGRASRVLPRDCAPDYRGEDPQSADADCGAIMWNHRRR